MVNLNTIEISNSYVFNLFQDIKSEIFKQNNKMMSDEELLLFLMMNNSFVDIKKKNILQ